MIPFRESKLTHLLMPILCRSGLSGVGLIACINPQVDDYDETISILGNASLASKIKEISDIGRTMGPAAEVAPAVDPKKRKLEPPLAKPPKKTKAVTISSSVVESAAVSTLPAPVALPRLVPVSTTNTSTNPVGNNNEPDTTAAVEEVPDEIPPANLKSAVKSSAKSAVKSVAKAPVISAPVIPTVPLVEYEELEKETTHLRADVRRLTEENTTLRMMQIHREHEIRVEVSEEMALRTSQLLMQLESLQKQLNANQQSLATDITKSVRKAQKRQREVAKEDETYALQEAESEIRRLKEAHEQEVSQLLVQKAALEKELKDWRTRAETAANALARNHQDQLLNKQQKAATTIFSPIAEKPEPVHALSKPAVVEKPSNPQVTNEFYKRMERDSRFMKSVMNESENTIPVSNSYSAMSSSSSSSSSNNLSSYSYTKPTLSVSKSATKGLSLSPSRSPLSVIKGDGNSPIRLDALSVTSKPIIDKQKLVTAKPQTHVATNSVEASQSPSVKRFRTRSQRV